jgi:hypothetical protein
MFDKCHFRQKKNADFTWSQAFSANFTGSTFKMEIRNSADIVVATLTSDPAAGITPTFGGTTTLDFFLAQADLPAIGTYTYDVLRLTPNGGDPDFSEFLMGGNYVIVAGVTEP